MLKNLTKMIGFFIVITTLGCGNSLDESTVFLNETKEIISVNLELDLSILPKSMRKELNDTKVVIINDNNIGIVYDLKNNPYVATTKFFNVVYPLFS